MVVLATAMLLHSCSGICRFCLKRYAHTTGVDPDTIRLHQTDTIRMERVVEIKVPGDTILRYISIPANDSVTTLYTADSALSVTVARVDSQLLISAIRQAQTVRDVVRWDTIVQWRDTVICPPQLYLDDPPAKGDFLDKLPPSAIWFLLIGCFVGGMLFRQFMLKFPL
jgi:hypothetical protein